MDYIKNVDPELCRKGESMNDIRKVLSYNDISLVPRFSNKRHLSDANLIFDYEKLPIPFSAVPLINAPMDKVCSPELLNLLYTNFDMPVTIHRWFHSVDEQLAFLKKCNFDKENMNPNSLASVFISVGSVQKWKSWVDSLIKKWNKLRFGILVDMANGDSITCVETAEYIRSKLKDCNIMAGNVATRSGYLRLEEVGTNIIRCGVGGGSVCSTRTSVGMGVPTLTSTMDCAKVKTDESYLLADGGIEYYGDICKAMAAGADMVMAGKLFAGTSLSAGMKFDKRGKFVEPENYETQAKWVNYTGMASKDAQEGLKSKKTAISIEGMSKSIVPYVGHTKEVIDNVMGNMRSSMAYYGGCSNWKEFKKRIKFVEMTTQGWGESLPRVVEMEDQFDVTA